MLVKPMPGIDNLYTLPRMPIVELAYHTGLANNLLAADKISKMVCRAYEVAANTVIDNHDCVGYIGDHEILHAIAYAAGKTDGTVFYKVQQYLAEPDARIKSMKLEWGNDRAYFEARQLFFRLLKSLIESNEPR